MSGPGRSGNFIPGDPLSCARLGHRATWFITTVTAWFAILITGKYPAALHPFGIGVLRWAVRLEAYMLLLVDEFPPFTLHEPAA